MQWIVFSAILLNIHSFLMAKRVSMKLTSSAFNHQAEIPQQYTCDGKNINPPLRWQDAPENTKSFVLIVDDPDAPKKTWVHWVVYNIPTSMHEIAENASATLKFALQGINDFSTTTYGGPCPPSGKHRYYFKLYALDSMLSLPSGARKAEVERAMQGHIVAQATLMGSYQRKS